MSWLVPGDAQKASFLPRRSIGGFTATVTIEEVGIDELAITEHPVQQGAAITDHAYNKPAEVSLSVMWSDEDAPLAETYKKLLELQASREPFDLVTGKREYKNMLIASLRQTTDSQTENVLSLSLSLREVFITSVEAVSASASSASAASVPEPEKQANPGKTAATQRSGKRRVQDTKQDEGAGSTQSSRRRSALSSLFGG